MRNLKRIMAVLCAVALVTTSFGSFGSVYADVKQVKKPAVAANYQEVPEKYRAAMQRAVEMGLITPDMNGSLRPNDVMTLAEYATVYHRMYGKWFNAQDAEDMPLLYGKITINGKDAKNHWAYIPLYYARFSAGLMNFIDTVKKPDYTKNFMGESNIVSNKPVCEVLLYLKYGFVATGLRHTKEYEQGARYLVEGKYDNHKVALNSIEEKIKEIVMVAGRGGGNVTDIIAYAVDGVKMFQSAGLIELKADGLDLHPAREITRAEVIYILLSMDNYVKSRGFRGIHLGGADIYREEIKELKSKK